MGDIMEEWWTEYIESGIIDRQDKLKTLPAFRHLFDLMMNSDVDSRMKEDMYWQTIESIIRDGLDVSFSNGYDTGKGKKDD